MLRGVLKAGTSDISVLFFSLPFLLVHSSTIRYYLYERDARKLWRYAVIFYIYSNKSAVLLKLVFLYYHTKGKCKTFLLSVGLSFILFDINLLRSRSAVYCHSSGPVCCSSTKERYSFAWHCSCCARTVRNCSQIMPRGGATYKETFYRSEKAMLDRNRPAIWMRGGAPGAMSTISWAAKALLVRVKFKFLRALTN